MVGCFMCCIVVFGMGVCGWYWFVVCLFSLVWFCGLGIGGCFCWFGFWVGYVVLVVFVWFVWLVYCDCVFFVFMYYRFLWWVGFEWVVWWVWLFGWFVLVA